MGSSSQAGQCVGKGRPKRESLMSIARLKALDNNNDDSNNNYNKNQCYPLCKKMSPELGHLSCPLDPDHKQAIGVIFT